MLEFYLPAMITAKLLILQRQLTSNFLDREILALLRKSTSCTLLTKNLAEHQVDIFNEVRNTEVVEGGDGRCDSPGHSAKYGTYSIVNTASSKVLDFSLV